MKHAIRSMVFHRLGVDIVRYPHPNSLGAHLKRLFAVLDINLVLDVGAHYGEYAIFLRQVVGYRGAIVSFEPVSVSFQVLKPICERDNQWACYNLALGSTNEIRPIHITQASNFSSLGLPNQFAFQRFGEAVRVQHTETVQIRRLDEVFTTVIAENIIPRAFLKLDTQGWDREVLQGATRCLPSILALQAELPVKAIYDDPPPPTWLELLAETSHLGFAVTGLFPVSRDRDLSVIEFDCVFTRSQQTPVRLDDR
jgi:FkbM family methyltransferase